MYARDVLLTKASSTLHVKKSLKLGLYCFTTLELVGSEQQELVLHRTYDKKTHSVKLFFVYIVCKQCAGAIGK